MQKDIKLGLIVGVVLLVLCAVFYFRSGMEEPVVPAPSETEPLELTAPESTEPQPLEEALPEQTKIEDVNLEEPVPAAEVVTPPVETEEETTKAVIEGVVEEEPVIGKEEEVETPPAPTATKEEPATPVEPQPLPPARKPLLTEGEVYVVEKGDTLGDISERFYGTSRYWKLIFEANRDLLSNPDRLVVGMELTIPPLPEETTEVAKKEEAPTTLSQETTVTDEEVIRHIVERGETLTSISEFYFGDGNAWKKIAAANPGLDPNRIKPGQVIIIPKH